MGKDVFTYFAYGSNMFSTWLRSRCPSATPMGAATRPDHELRWHKSSNDGSGKCDIVQVGAGRAVVHGVLYEVHVSELPALDRAEGRGYGYERQDVTVLLDGSERSALTYQATKTDPSLRPYFWYHALVLAGAREHGLPDSYVSGIEAVDWIEDPDRARHDRNTKVLTGAGR